MDEPQDPRWDMAAFGRMAEDFLRGPIGLYLVKKAQIQSRDAVEILKTADAEDPKGIRALQTKIQVADSIMGWLGEAIHEGQMALEHLKEDHDE